MFKERMTPEELANLTGYSRQTINKWVRKEGWATSPKPGVQGGKARLVHVTEQVREYIRSAERSAEGLSDNLSLSGDTSIEALLIRLAKEMTPSEQKMFTSLILREGITGLLQRLGSATTNNMKKLRSKMTTEELAECLGVAKQTVNRWIREQNWTTEKFPGVKGGRARLIHIDSSVRTFLLNIPAFRKVPEIYQAEEPLAEYTHVVRSHACRQIISALDNMSPTEQEKLAMYISREGIRTFLTRLGIDESE